MAAERLLPDTGEAANENKKYGKVDKVLVHARGCTAVKLIRKAQEKDRAAAKVRGWHRNV